MVVTRRGLAIVTAFVVLIGLAVFLVLQSRSKLDDTRSTLGDMRSKLASTQAALASAHAEHASDVESGKAARAMIARLKARIAKLDPPSWSKREAGRQYLAMVKPGNDRIDRYNKLTNPTFGQEHRYCSDMARIDNQFAQTLQTGHWPKFARPAVNELIDSIASDVDSYTSCEDARTVDAQNAVVFGTNKAAQKVRIVLGLPHAS